MADNKTKATQQSVAAYLKGIQNPGKRADSQQLVKLMQAVSKAKPKMWGSMIGFGELHYKLARTEVINKEVSTKLLIVVSLCTSWPPDLKLTA